MARHVVLLRGINLVKRNRVAIGVLRAVLESDGFGDVQTYIQSGNVALSSRASPESVAKRVNLLIKKRFGFDITVLVRSHAELATVVRRNPLREGRRQPKGLHRHLPVR